MTEFEYEILTLIAEGYLHEVSEDRYIICENPNYRPDNGSDPFIVYDLYSKDEK